MMPYVKPSKFYQKQARVFPRWWPTVKLGEYLISIKSPYGQNVFFWFWFYMWINMGYMIFWKNRK